MKHLRPAIVLTAIFIVVFGFGFPFLMYGIGRAFPHQADGSMVKDAKGNIVGSELIGQNFTKPQYFHPRPSAAGNGYDANNSSGTNLGPTSDKLINGIHKKLPNGQDDPGNFDGVVDLVKAYRKENGLADNAQVPADAVTRSASGLDPQISVANAMLQVPRVAKARGISEDEVRKTVADNTGGRFLGIFGDSGVNVLMLNLALDKAHPVPSGK